MGTRTVGCVLAVAVMMASRNSSAIVVGAGAETCGEYITDQAKKDTDVKSLISTDIRLSWVQGYIFGFQQAAIAVSKSNKKLATTDPAALQQSLKNYCANHPLATLMEAGLDLLGDLAQRQR